MLLKCSSLMHRSTNLLFKPLKRSRSVAYFSTSSSETQTTTTSGERRRKFDINEVPSFKEILRSQQPSSSKTSSASTLDDLKDNDFPPYLPNDVTLGQGRNVFVETYGCQMNVSDSEIVASIMQNAGFQLTTKESNADVIFLNTCAVREKAEQKVWDRLTELKTERKKNKRELTVGVLGCMAERLKKKLLEADKLVDIVVGPDAYRDLPRLLAKVDIEKQPAINVILSQDETYADIAPVRVASNGVTAFVSIMRGCNNMCSYCIVPFTRGRERSRDPASICEEVRQLSKQGYKEVILLGQNVNSYNYLESDSADEIPRIEKNDLSPGFRNVFTKPKSGVTFTQLLEQVSKIDPELRVRFTSPHPKDFPVSLLHLISTTPNLCKGLHMPAQSGSSTVLERMRRGYTREAYLDLISSVKTIIPDATLSSDFISGFCGETDQEHQDTISLLETVKFEQAFTFAYSVREKTHAHRNYSDDVPHQTKQQRLQHVIQTFNSAAESVYRKHVGKKHLVLVEGNSKRSSDDLVGRTDGNMKVIFPNIEIPSKLSPNGASTKASPGEYVLVEIENSSSHSLFGKPLEKSSIVRHHSV